MNDTEIQGPPEPVRLKCAGCNVPILTLWAPGNRGMLRGPYLLMGDNVVHPKCFDLWCKEVYARAD